MALILSQKFKEAYNKLNPEQKEAVDSIEGPVMVIAGPGTGKTEILTLRIANIILKTDTPPESILALTFTESGVHSMKKRLIELIGSAAYEVYITTFHGFANSVIQNYPEFFPEIIGSVHISEADQIKIIREILEKSHLEYLKPKNNPYFYLTEIKKIIEDLKRENIEPKELEKIIQQEEENFYQKSDLFNKEGKLKPKYIETKRNLEKNKELLTIYEKYEQTLKKKKYYDYNDMILQLAKTLEKNEDLLSILQEKHQYILVDEHQDTNKAQNKILELLASFYPNPNLFVVGDAKQAIFRFQGASLENFLYFKKRYKGVKLITLKRNYRSTQTILDAAFELIGKKDEKLIAHYNKKSLPIKICAFSKNEYENFFIAQKILELIKRGVKAENIAIIFRENKDAYPIASFLEKLNIDFYIDADENILTDTHIYRLKVILNAIQNFGNDEFFLQALQASFEEISQLDIYKLIILRNKLKKERQNKEGIFYEIAKSPDLLKKHSIENAESIFNFYKKMNVWKSEAIRDNPLNVLEDVVRESGLLKDILKNPDGQNKLQKLCAFYNHLRSLVETHKNFLLEDFIEYLNLLETHNIKIKNFAHLPPQGKVRLLTAHKAKGQEFDIVFIINAIDGKWGSKRQQHHIKLPTQVYSLLQTNLQHEISEEDDELNIFYVALTRARKDIFITYSKTDEAGNIKQPSKFILRINPQLITYINTENEEKKLDNQSEIIFIKNKKSLPSLEEKEYLNQLFEEQGLSVTALNNFLECPWKFFYRNLLRIPEAPELSLMYGNAIHYALKKFFEAFKKGEKPKKEYLINMFATALYHEPIDEINLEAFLKRGIKALSGYFQKYHQAWINNNILVEKNIDGVLIENVKLNGKIDKIEILDLANNVNVVDYKTGEPKSLNFVKGLTKNSIGSYFRQLVFYKILLDNYQNGKYQMKTGTIDFIEPTKKGVYKKYTLEITPEDEKKVKEEIKTTAEKIRNLSFWNEFCNDKNCRYCKLRKMIDK